MGSAKRRRTVGATQSAARTLVHHGLPLNRPRSRGALSIADLEALFAQKYGAPETTGWAPRRRFRFGYYLPADAYECLVSQNVAAGCSWLDVGGGHSIFPNNTELASTLVLRCATVVAVDPSENVLKNTFVHERVRSKLEDYAPSRQFGLATLRMVVEHVPNPKHLSTRLDVS